ncbi:MAG: hypothetical protein JJE15_08520 [Desulfobacteraceae bacterium]|nr:hypothetical protein [Desulfobacteraceae bacterium]
MSASGDYLVEGTPACFSNRSVIPLFTLSWSSVPKGKDGARSETRPL